MIVEKRENSPAGFGEIEVATESLTSYDIAAQPGIAVATLASHANEPVSRSSFVAQSV